MIINCTDTETTGLDHADGHRIVEICMVLYDTELKKIRGKYTQRIHPGRSIQPKAQEVHGISITDLSDCPKWADVAPKVNKILKASDLLVAHNMAFDSAFIVGEQIRVGITPPNIETFCTMENGRWATPYGKNPSLAELCFALGIEYDPSKAHAAEYDVVVMLKCLLAGVRRGAFVLPEIENKEAA